MIHLIQLMLPLYEKENQEQPASVHTLVKAELTKRFGNLTVCIRSRAGGCWKEAGQGPKDDQVVIYEVMPLSLDDEWWNWYRENLTMRFRRAEVTIRSLPTF